MYLWKAYEELILKKCVSHIHILTQSLNHTIITLTILPFLSDLDMSRI